MIDLRMPNINKVIISGNLTADPILNTTNTNQVPVINFRIASSRKFVTSTKQQKEDVCYVNIVAWLGLAEACNKFLKKGDPVLIEGELRSRNWTTEQGEKKSGVEILAKRVQFLKRSIYNNEAEDAETDIETTETPINPKA
jgi:single-strand DNA-binding protein